MRGHGGVLRSLPGRQAVLACIVVALAWGSAAAAKQQIRIEVDGRVVEHATLQRTLGAALDEAGISLGPQDKVVPSPEAPVRRGMTARVIRGVRVSVVADGKRSSFLTQPVSVAEALRLAGVRLGSSDRVTPSLEERVKDGTEIRVTRVLERVERERFEIAAPVERIADPSLERGRMRVVRQGKPGEGERLVKVTYFDGKPGSRQVLQERIISPPVSRLIAYGTLDTICRGGAVLRFRSALEMVATAYSARVGKRTATGAAVRYGVAAVDPAVIPLGTRLYVEGYGYATALDVGGSIKGNRIDLFFPSEYECNRWGRRVVKVYILE